MSNALSLEYKRHTPPLAIPGQESGRNTPLPVLILAMGLVIVPLIALSQVIAYFRWDVVDDQMFGYFGWRIAHGATVYLDVWDNKPPGIYWINALGMILGNDSYLGVVGLCVVALVAAHACFFAICSSLFFRGAAACSTVLLCFFLTHAFFTGGTNRTETFLVPFELAAVLFYVRGFARDRWWKWLSVGLCAGVAFLFKQVGLAAWGAMGLHTIILVLTGDVSMRDGFRRCLLMLAGVCVVVLAAAGALAAQGALGEAVFAVFLFNRAYFDTGTSEWPYSYKSWYLLKEHFFPILRLPLLMAIAATVHAVLWRVRPRVRPPEIEQPLRALKPVCPRYFLLFSIWFLASFWGALLSPHAFRHYLVPTIPPLLLLAAYLVNVLQAEMRLLVRLQQRAWVTAAFVAIAYFSFDAGRRQWEEMSTLWVFRVEQGERAQWEVIGDAVKAVTGPDDKIHCWGYYPGVYLWARRENASRFTTTEKVGQVGEQANFVMRELDETLKADPPVVLVVSCEDYEWLHGRRPDKGPPAVKLGPWIDETYERVADIPGINAYIFKDRALVQPADRELQNKIGDLLRN
ncbi:MAG: glycosyltransferase family 39 protein [Planctomycetota bacterium]